MTIDMNSEDNEGSIKTGNRKNDELVFLRSSIADCTIQEILDNLEDLIVVLDPGYRIVYVTKSLTDCLGYAAEELEGRHVNVLYPYGKNVDIEAVLAEIAAGKKDSYTIPLVSKDESFTPAQTKATRIILADEEYIIAIIREVNREEKSNNLILLQRNLAINLSGLSSLEEALEACLDSAIHISGMDSGGIYQKDVSTGDFNLTHIRGVSGQFVQFSSCISWDSPMAKLVERKIPIYINHETFDPIDIIPDLKIEGLKSLAIVPILHDSQVFALFMVASHSLEHMPINKCIALESVTTMIGNSVHRLQMEEHKRTQERAQKDLYHIIRLMCVHIPNDREHDSV